MAQFISEIYNNFSYNILGYFLGVTLLVHVVLDLKCKLRVQTNHLSKRLIPFNYSLSYKSF